MSALLVLNQKAQSLLGQLILLISIFVRSQSICRGFLEVTVPQLLMSTKTGCFVAGAGVAEGRDNRALMFFSIVVTRDLNIGMEKDRKSMFIKLAEFIGVITADRFFFGGPSIVHVHHHSFIFTTNSQTRNYKKKAKKGAAAAAREEPRV